MPHRWNDCLFFRVYKYNFYYLQAAGKDLSNLIIDPWFYFYLQKLKAWAFDEIINWQKLDRQNNFSEACVLEKQYC